MLAVFAILLAPTAELFPAAAPGPLDNPYKGFASYAGSKGLPSAMTYEYVPWRTLEPNQGKYAFDTIEKNWGDRPRILRFVLDTPKRDDLPDWVRNAGVPQRKYAAHGGGMSPDYDDPRLLKPLLKTIDAMGKRWDEDPRVAGIVLGTLGHWGEWHTWPEEGLMAKDATQRAVVAAYRRAFPSQPLYARYGQLPALREPFLGYHDDSFPDHTLAGSKPGGPWRFLPELQTAGLAERWKTRPMGAEMMPRGAKKALGPDWEKTVAALKAAHFSWIGPYNPAVEPHLPDLLKKRAEELIRMSGYEFRLTRIARTDEGNRWRIRVEGVNQGVAPFYRPWPVRLARLDADGVVTASVEVAVDVRTWLPGPFSFEATIPSTTQPTRIALGIEDPVTLRPRIRFANRLEVVKGWTVLETLRGAPY